MARDRHLLSRALNVACKEEAQKRSRVDQEGLNPSSEPAGAAHGRECSTGGCATACGPNPESWNRRTDLPKGARQKGGGQLYERGAAIALICFMHQNGSNGRDAGS